MVSKLVSSTGSHRDSVEVEIEHPIKRGDGVVFDAASWRSPDQPEEGGNVYEVRPRGTNVVELEFGHDSIQFSRIRVGDLVWRTSDPQLIRKLRPLTKTEVPVFTRPIAFYVKASLGKPLEIEARLESGEKAMFTSEAPLAAAQNRALDDEVLQEKLGRLGGTPFHLKEIQLLTQDHAFVPTSLLNHARRQLVDELFDACGQLNPHAASPALQTERERIESKNRVSREEELEDSVAEKAIHLLVRTAEQLDAAIEASSAVEC